MYSVLMYYLLRYKFGFLHFNKLLSDFIDYVTLLVTL